MSNFQKLLNKFTYLTTSPDVIAGIKNNQLLNLASDYISRLNNIINGDSQETVICKLSNYIGVISASRLRYIISSQVDSIDVDCIDPNTNSTTVQSYPTEVVLDAIAREVDLTKLESGIIPILTSVSDGLTLEGVKSLVDGVISESTTDVGVALQKIVNNAATYAASADEFKQVLLDHFTRQQGLIFSPTTVGDATNAVGLSLWCKIDFSSIQAFISTFSNKILSGLKRFVRNFSDGYALQLESQRLANASISYTLTNIFQDEWVSYPISASANKSQDFSFSNGFIDCGALNDVDLSEKANRLGLSANSAICFPTIGATWYIFMNEEDVPHLGLSRHCYNSADGQRILTLVSQTGNTVGDVADLISTIRPLYWTGESTVGQLNDKYAYCSYITSSLVSLGLLILAKQNIENRYYQDPQSMAIPADKLFRITNYESISGRGDFISAVTSPISANALAFAKRHLSMYMDNYLSDSSDATVGHILVSSPLIGSYQLMDDALTVSSISTSIKVGFSTVVAVALAIGIGTAMITLRQGAMTAVVNANRAMNDVNVDPTEAYNLVKKARFLSKVGGLKDSSINALIGNTVIPAITTTTESTATKISNLSLNVDSVKNLISKG